MLARLAENLFWAGRYLERAEDTARMMDVIYHGLLESPLADPGSAWESLLSSLGQLESFEETGRELTEELVVDFLVTADANPGSVAHSVEALRENIRSLREQVSAELWEATNSLYLELRGRDLLREVELQPYALYGMVKQRCQTIAGVADETMPRDDGWRFFILGHRLERAIMGVRLLRVQFGDLPGADAIDFHRWRVLLRAASAFEAYSRRRDAALSPDEAVDFLLLDTQHPRSVLFCLRIAEAQLEELSSPDPDRSSLRALGRARANLEFSEPADRRGQRRDEFLHQLISDVQRVVTSIEGEFFLPARPGSLHAVRAD